MPITLTRRRFLTTPPLVGVAGLAPLLQALAAEGSLETTTVQLSKDFAICEAPLDVAYELLRAEGFTDIRYVDTSADEVFAAVARRKVDFALDFPVLFVPAIDSGEPITVLAGVHVGCFELFGHEGIRSIADLKGKQVGVLALGSSQHVYLATMLSYRSRLHPQLSLCLGRVEQVALQPMARMGSQRHASVLRSPAGRGRPDQV